MKQIKRTLVILVALLLCIGCIAVSAFAAETSQDGLEVTLTTDKTEYGQDETIVATLTVKNTNTFAVYNVSLESAVPEGYVLAEGSKTALSVKTLAAGESVTLTVRLAPEVTAEPSTKPGTETPPTGDGSYIVLWFLLLLAAGSGITVLVVKRKMWKRAISFVLCLAMLMAMIPATVFTAEAAGAEVKTIDIKTSVEAAGAPVELKATVKYSLSAAETVYHTVLFNLNYEDAPQMSARQVADGTCMEPPEDPVREGYSFGYWFVQSGDTFVQYDFTAPVTEDLVLYAYWADPNENVDITTLRKVRFGYPSTLSEEELNEIHLPVEQVVQSGQLVYSMPEAEREGYVFAGWYYDAALTQPAAATDVVEKDVTLYPLLVESLQDESGYATNNYVADLDVWNLTHSVTVKAPSRQHVLDYLEFVDIFASELMEINVVDNGDGTYTVTPVGGLKGGRSYQLRVTDRELPPAQEYLDGNFNDAFILFYHNDILQSRDVKYYNIFTAREEVNNMKLSDDFIPIPAEQVEGLDMDAASSLFTLITDETGNTVIEDNATEGTFTYSGEALSVGDMVLVYVGGPEVEEEYRTSGTVAAAEKTAFLKITAVEGTTYTYQVPDTYDALYVPDILPLPLQADTDGAADDNKITVADSYLDFRYLPVESNVLDEDTTADVGDFVVLYAGTADAPGELRYGRITSVTKENGFTTLAFDEATLEDVESAIDSYILSEVPLNLTEEDQVELENVAVQQALDSGFAQEAAALTIREKMGLSEDLVWGRTYTMTQQQAETLDVEVEYGEVDAGIMLIQFQIDPIDVAANISTTLQRVTAINGGEGLRVAFGVYIPIGIEIVNILSNEVEESLTMDLYVTLEQELAIDLGVTLDMDIDWWLCFPTDISVTLTASFEIGIYTGVGAVISVDTQKNYDKSYIWNELLGDNNGTSGGAFTVSSSLADQLNTMLSEGNTSFFDQYQDGNGNSTLIDSYAKMLEKNVDYMTILNIPLGAPRGFRGKIVPQTPVAEYVIAPSIVFGAKLNVVLGTSFEAMNVKEYTFSLKLSTSDGVSASSEVLDKQTPFHSFNMMIFGNIGFRAGFLLDAKIGLYSCKICNVGVTLELGFYLDLYGFGYYHYDWSRDAKTGKENVNKQMAGAFYLEIGFYMDIYLYGGALMDLFTFSIQCLELKVPIWSTGDQEYAARVRVPGGFDELSKTVYFKREYVELNMTGSRECFYYVEYFNIKTGEWTRSERKSADFFTVEIPENMKSVVSYEGSYRDPVSGKFVHRAAVTPEFQGTTTTFTVNLVASASAAGAGGELDSVYDLIGSLKDSVTVNWKWNRSQEDYSIYVDGDEYFTFYPYYYKNFRNLRSVRHLVEERQGYEFAGWEVSWWEDAPTEEDPYNNLWHEDRINDLPDLNGRATGYTSYFLHPLYSALPVEYQIHHMIPSLADPEEYEVFIAETLIGRTNCLTEEPINYLRYHEEGVTPDISKLKFIFYDMGAGMTGAIADNQKRVAADGSTVLYLYYTRDSYDVQIFANNPDLSSHSDLPDIHRTAVVYGYPLTDPGYAETKVPGYTFVGWSTTPDASSGIMESLPDSFSPSDGLSYYAIWEPDNAQVRIECYVLDPYGDYQFQGEEYRYVPYGTELWSANFMPEEVELDEDVYVKKMETFDWPDGNAVDVDYLSSSCKYYVIKLYFNLDYTMLSFNYERSYEKRYTEITLPSLEKQGYVFAGWRTSVAGDETVHPAGEVYYLERSQYWFYPVFTAADDTPYTVEHYLEKTDGTYSETPDEAETLFGTTESRVTPEVKTYTGFVSPATLTVTVEADGSTVVQYFYKRATYGVTLDYQIEGEDLSLRGQYAISYKYGVPFYLTDIYSNPISIQRDGYVITSWYLADETLNPDKTPLDPTTYLVEGDALTSQKELVFKPVWEKVPCGYKVEHYLEQLDGTYALQQTDELTAYIHDTVTAQAAAFTGFTFDDSVEGTVLSAVITTENEVPVLKLYYTRNSYDALWYDYDGTTLLTTTQFKFGQTVTAPSVSATRVGYTFGGWNVGTVTMTASGASFNAKDHGNWTANTYTVTFDPNGGTGTMAVQTFTYDQPQSLTANAFVNEGYTFTGWSLSENGEVVHGDQAQVKNLAPSGNVTLYAQWTAGTATAYKIVYYGLTLDGSGYEEIKTEEYTGVTNSAVIAAAIEIAGFTYDASNANNVTSGTVAGDGSLVLKLYYTRNSYTLTLDFNGESMKQAVQNEDTGIMEVGSFATPDQTVTLKYGQTLADALTDIKVSVMTQEGGWVWNDELGEDEYVDPVYEDVAFETAFPGYTFNEWEGLTDTMPAEDLTLTAQWTPIQITVTFYSGYSSGYTAGVTGTTFSQVYNYGDTVAYPEHDFAWEGYTITGWKFGNGAGGLGQYAEINTLSFELLYGFYASVGNEDFVSGDTELNVSAYWTSNSYLLTVQFNGNGAESGTMEDFLLDGYGGSSLVRNKFKREGYTFAGWNTEADGSGDSYMDGDWISGTGTITLYAQWEPVTE